MAIFAIAAFVSFLALQNSEPQPTKQQKEYAARCNAEKDSYSVFLGSIENWPHAKPSEDKAHEEKARRNQTALWCDLFAQETAAQSAWLSVKEARYVRWLTALGVLLLGATLYFTARTLAEAKKATKAARDTASVTREVGEAAVRPILFVDKILQRGNIITDVDIEISRTGETAALCPVVIATCKAYSPFFSSEDHRLDRVVQTKGLTREETGEQFMPFSFDLTNALIREHTGGDGRLCQFYIDVCILYDDVFTVGTDRDVHFTRQRFGQVAGRGHPWKGEGQLKMGKTNREEYEQERAKIL